MVILLPVRRMVNKLIFIKTMLFAMKLQESRIHTYLLYCKNQMKDTFYNSIDDAFEWHLNVKFWTFDK